MPCVPHQTLIISPYWCALPYHFRKKISGEKNTGQSYWCHLFMSWVLLKVGHMIHRLTRDLLSHGSGFDNIIH